MSYERGLDTFPIDLNFTPADLILKYQALGASGRYPHWTLERDYLRRKTLASKGISVALEYVANTNPVRVYLPEDTPQALQMLNFAYALAEADFYKNNVLFDKTNSQMDQLIHLHALRIRQYSGQYGKEAVASMFNAAYAIRSLIDPFALDKPAWQEYKNANTKQFKEATRIKEASKSPYDDLWDLEDKKPEPEVKLPQLLPSVPFPMEPEQDVLWFIATYSPKIEDWQRDILTMVRAEAQYFYPQEQTEIMRAGWKVYQARETMRELQNRGQLTQSASIEWSKAYATLTAPYPVGINPYSLGLIVWEDIARKYKGQPYPGEKVERDYKGDRIDPKSFAGRADYDPFLVRTTIPGDRYFLDNYLTPQLIKDLGLKKEDLMAAKAVPFITVAINGANYQGTGGLHLQHGPDGRDLNIDLAKETVLLIYNLWGRPVHLETYEKGRKIALDCVNEKIGTILTVS